MISIGVKGLALYMTAGEARKRRILHDYKYPHPAGHAQATYYTEARSAIKRYHESDEDVTVLMASYAALKMKAKISRGRRSTKLEHNAAAVIAYVPFSRNYKGLRLQKRPQLSLTHGNIKITMQPDIYAIWRKRPLILKFDFSDRQPEPRLVKVITQAYLLAARQSGISIKPRDVAYCEIRRGRIHNGSRIGSTVTRDIEAACDNIDAIWDRL
ncbi:MAG: hypothetical protein AB1483_07560 [Candidatus Zixiibacteriota bacterium]